MKKLSFAIFLFIFFSNMFVIKSQSWQWLTTVTRAESWLGGVTSIGNNLYSGVYSYEDTLYLPGSSVPILPRSSAIVKSDHNGDIIWVKSFGKTPLNLLTNSQENIFFAGSYHDVLNIDNFSINATNYEDIFIGCMDTLGNIKWLKSIGGDCSDVLKDFQADNFGNIFLTGKIPTMCDLYYESKGAFFISKFNSQGSLLWSQKLDSTMWNQKLNIGSDGAIYLTGSFNDSIKFNDHLNSWTYNASAAGFLVKIDSNSNIHWIKIFKSTDFQNVIPMKSITDNNQNVYIPVGTFGNFTCDGNTFTSTTIIKLNSDGIINQHLYTGTGTPQLKYMADNTIGACGNAENSHKIFKIGTDLNIIYTANILYHHPWGLHQIYFDTDINGDFLIGGNTSDSLSFSESNFQLPMLNFYQQQTYYTKFGYASIVGIPKNNLEEDLSLTVFPNPFSDIIKMKFVSPYKGEIQINIRNMKGQNIFSEKIWKIDNEIIKNIDLSKQAKGVYLIETITDNAKQTRKLVLN